MTKLVLLLFIVPSFLDKGPHTVLWGARHKADAEVNYQIIDSKEKPVSHAYVIIWYRIDYPRVIDWIEYKTTNDNGFFQAKARLNHSIHVYAYKDGFYPSEDEILVYETKSNPPIFDRKWQPYGITKKLILKKIRNPVKISRSEWTIEQKIPVFDQWCPLDLEKFMWLPPYGEGVYADMLVKCSSFASHDGNPPFETQTLDLSFTNNLHAGFYLMKKDRFSSNQYVYQASTNANYQNYCRYNCDSRIYEDQKQDTLHDDEYLVFRTRTRINSRGELIGAHYGLLSGAIIFGKKIRLVGRLFNPNENDPNLEDLTTAEHTHSMNKIIIERDFKGVK